MLSLFISVFYAGVCLGWGFLIVQVFSRSHIRLNADENFIDDSSIFLACSFLAGIAVVSSLLTVLGLIGQLRSLPLILVLLPGVVGLMLGRNYLRDFMFASLDALRAFKVMPLYFLIIGGFTALLAVSSGIGAWVLPPKGDAAAFYMVYPKIIAATGLLEPMHGPFYFFSVIGLPVELHYAALMVLADAHAAKLFIFPIAISVGVMLAGIVHLCGGGMGAVTLAWAMLFSSYTFHHYIYDGKVDLASVAFGLAAVYWILRGTELRVSVLACGVAGWFSGLATAAKFSYLLALGVSFSVLLVWRLFVSRSEETKLLASLISLARMCAVMIIAVIIAWLPQLIKNGILFDAPLAPFFGGQIEGNLLSQVWFSSDDTKKILLTYPFALVFGRYPMQGGGLSFLFLAFLPFLIWFSCPASRRKNMTIALAIAGLSGVLAWMLLRPSVIAPRYILVSLLLFVPILAIATEKVLAKKATSKILRVGTTLTALLAIAASFWHLVPIPGAIISGIGSRENVCLLASSECDSFQKLAKTARPGDRILIASYYPYWLTPSQLQCRDTLDEQRSMPDQGQLVRWLQSRGFSYVAIDPAVSPKLAVDLKELAISDGLNIHELPSHEPLKLYRISTEQIRDVRCVETSTGRWNLQKYSP